MENLILDSIKTPLLKFILSSICICCFSIWSMGQLQLIRQIEFEGDRVYADPLNQFYILNHRERSLSKLDVHLNLIKKTSFKQSWDLIQLDVSDPFKILLFYPGNYKLEVIDGNLEVIARFDEIELNSEACAAYFSTNQIIIYSNGQIKLKDYLNHSEIQSALIDQPQANDLHKKNQIKRSNSYIYLFQESYGVRRFTDQLFEDKSWMMKNIRSIDLSNQNLFFEEDNQLIRFSLENQMQQKIYQFKERKHSYSVNGNYLIILDGNQLLLYLLNS